MAQPYVWGPAHVYVGVGPGNAPLYLGLGEEGPDVVFRPQYEDVHVDVGGRVAFDSTQQSKEAAVSITLTRWNDVIYQIIHDLANSNFLTNTGGIEDPGEIGTLMIAENCAYQLFLVAPYSAKPVFQNIDSGPQVPGLRFPAAWLVDDSWGRLGVKPRRLSLGWRCLRTFDPSYVSPAGYGYGRFTLYDYNTAGLPIPN